jgi:hypothetical protein
VSMTTNPRQGKSGDAMLAELTQALGEIGREPPPLVRPNEEIFEREDAAGQSERQTLAAILGRLLPWPGALPSWSVVGLLAAACIGIIVFAWPSPDGRAVKPTTPPSVDAAKTDTGLQQLSSQAQTTPQRAGPAAASSPELTQRLQTIVREFANLEQGIEQLKTSQAQLARDNAELAGQLKETREEMARHDAELAKDLRAAQEEMNRDSLNTAAQLLSISERLKATQEQLNRLAAPKQLRPPKLASPSPPQPNATPAPKPARKPPSQQTGQLPKNSSRSEPKQP